MNFGNRYTGLINKYRDHLPVSDDTRIISLGEGNTPLIRLKGASQATGEQRGGQRVLQPGQVFDGEHAAVLGLFVHFVLHWPCGPGSSRAAAGRPKRKRPGVLPGRCRPL